MPIMSYETILAPPVLQTIGNPVIPWTSRPSNEPIVYKIGYVSYPEHRKTPASKVDIVTGELC
jgi:hypothetical protein